MFLSRTLPTHIRRTRVGTSIPVSNIVGVNLKVGELTCSACASGPYNDQMAYCLACGQPLAGGGLLNGKYRLLRILGEGALSQVYLAENEAVHKRLCAIKRIGPPKREVDIKAAGREGEMLAQLNNAGISGVPDIYETFAYNLSFFVVMEFVQGRDLLSWAREQQPGWQAVLTRFIPALETLARLHSLPQPITHSDFKPSNILEDNNGHIWLVDFGFADIQRPSRDSSSSGGSSYQWGGTPRYMPWEQYQRRPTPAADVYAAGISLYQLLVDEETFKTIPKFSLEPISGITTESYLAPEWPPQLKQALLAATTALPEERISARQFVELLLSCLPTSGSGTPLTLQGGIQLIRPEDFAALADRQWEVALRLFREGTLFRWLRDGLFRDDLAQEVLKIQKHTGEVNEALEAILHVLDKQLPHPIIRCLPDSLTPAPLGLQPLRQQVTLSNAGRGYTKVTLRTTAPWLHLHPQQLSLPAKAQETVTVTIYPASIPRWRSAVTAEIEALTATQTLIIPLTTRVRLTARIWQRLLLPILRPLRMIAGLGGSLALAGLLNLTTLEAAQQLAALWRPEVSLEWETRLAWSHAGALGAVLITPAAMAAGALLGRLIGIGRTTRPFSIGMLLRRWLVITMSLYAAAAVMVVGLMALAMLSDTTTAVVLTAGLPITGILLTIVAAGLALPVLPLPRDPYESPWSALVGPALMTAGLVGLALLK